MQVTGRRTDKIEASYTYRVLDNASQLHMTGDGIHIYLISNMWTKANRTLCFLGRNLNQCPKDVREAAYKRPVYPIGEYGSWATEWSMKKKVEKFRIELLDM